MRKWKLVIGLTLALGAIASMPVAAFAEFSSGVTSGKAKGESVLEGEGFAVTCPSAEAEWKLPKSPSNKELQLAKASKNVCTVKSESIKEVPVEESACEGELTSNSKAITKEAEILGTILSVCTTTFKVLGMTCEIKAEPEGNKELKSGTAKNEGSNIALSGESIFTIEIEGVCPGIKGSATVKNQGKEIFENEKLAEGPASGSGPYWHVNGSRLESSVKQIKQQLKGAAFLKAPGTLELECKSSISEGGTIEGNGAAQGQGKGRVTFSSCKVLVPTENKCIVAEPITTNPLKSYLAKAATQTGIVEVFEPGQGTTLAVMKFTENGKCVFKEAGAAGTVVAEVIPAGTENQEDLVAFPKTAILKVKHEGVEVTLPSLKVVGSVATFSGTYGMRLATFPEKFGVFET